MPYANLWCYWRQMPILACCANVTCLCNMATHPVTYYCYMHKPRMIPNLATMSYWLRSKVKCRERILMQSLRAPHVQGCESTGVRLEWSLEKNSTQYRPWEQSSTQLVVSAHIKQIAIMTTLKQMAARAPLWNGRENIFHTVRERTSHVAVRESTFHFHQVPL